MAGNRVTVYIDGDSRGVESAAKGASRALQQFGQGVMNGFGVGAGFGFVDLGRQAAAGLERIAVESITSAARVERLSRAMDTLAKSQGGNAKAILSSLKAASDGAVSNADLILSANRAMMLGLGADANKLANLLEVARFRGEAMGLDTATAIDNIVTGIGRMSPMILDNLGFIIDADRTYGAYARTIGKSANALTDLEKKQALLNRVLDEGNRQIKAAGGLAAAPATEKINAQLANIKAQLGQLGWESGVVPVTLNFVARGLEGWNKFFEDWKTVRDWEASHGGRSAGTAWGATLGPGNYPGMPQSFAPWLGRGEGYREAGLSESAMLMYGQMARSYGTEIVVPNATIKAPNFAPIDFAAAQAQSLMAARWTALGQEYASGKRSALSDRYIGLMQQVGQRLNFPMQYPGVEKFIGDGDKTARTLAAMGSAAAQAEENAHELTLSMNGIAQAAASASMAQLRLEHTMGGASDAVIGFIDRVNAKLDKEIRESLFAQEGWMGLASLQPGAGMGFMESVTSPDIQNKARDFFDRIHEENVAAGKRANDEYWRDYASKAREAQSALQGFISGAFESSPSFRGGLVGTAFQLGNAWDERARRVLDVGNLGAASPWAAGFSGWQGLNDEQRRAWAEMQAEDIRNRPSIEKLGPEGMEALKQTALQNIQAEVDKQKLFAEVQKAILQNPEAVANLKQLGIDVEDAFKEPADKITDHIDSLKTSVLDVRIVGGLGKGEGGEGGGGKAAAPEGNGRYGLDTILDTKHGLAAGGVVPGVGPVPIMMHGGENVFTPDQMRQILLNMQAGTTQNFTGNQFILKSDTVRGLFRELSQLGLGA